MNISRCFKCLAYGHFAAKCKAAESLCETSGLPGHKKEDCPSKSSPKCANCVRSKRKDLNHHVKSRVCPEYERHASFFRSRLETLNPADGPP